MSREPTIRHHLRQAMLVLASAGLKDCPPAESVDNARALRTEYGLTHEEVAEIVGTRDVSLVQRFEAGQLPTTVAATTVFERYRQLLSYLGMRDTADWENYVLAEEQKQEPAGEVDQELAEQLAKRISAEASRGSFALRQLGEPQDRINLRGNLHLNRASLAKAIDATVAQVVLFETEDWRFLPYAGSPVEDDNSKALESYLRWVSFALKGIPLPETDTLYSRVLAANNRGENYSMEEK